MCHWMCEYDKDSDNSGLTRGGRWGKMKRRWKRKRKKSLVLGTESNKNHLQGKKMILGEVTCLM